MHLRAGVNNEERSGRHSSMCGDNIIADLCNCDSADGI